MKNLFLVIFLSFALVYYYLHTNYWSKVTSRDLAEIEQTEPLEDPVKEVNRLSENKKISQDSIRAVSQIKPAL